MEVPIRVRKKLGKYKISDISSNDILTIPKFLVYSIRDETGIGLIYELKCYSQEVSKKLRKIGTLDLYLIETGKKARVSLTLYEKEGENGTKSLTFSFRGPVYRYLNLENKIILELLKEKIREICTEEESGNLGRTFLRLLYKNCKLMCEHTDEKPKQHICELTTYIGCALKSIKLSELIYRKFNPSNCMDMTESNSSKRGAVKRNFISYIV